MRTIEEIQQQLAHEPDKDDGSYQHSQDAAYDDGFDAGMRTGAKLVQQGKSSADILHYAQADELGYLPHGNDDEDAWQSGYSTALFWCAEQFDWNAEGVPVYRAGNVWSLSADGHEQDEAGEAR